MREQKTVDFGWQFDKTLGQHTESKLSGDEEMCRPDTKNSLTFWNGWNKLRSRKGSGLDSKGLAVHRVLKTARWVEG